MIRLTSLLLEKNIALELDKMVRKFAALKNKNDEKHNIDELTKIINAHIDEIQNVEKKFSSIIKKALPKKHLKGKVKFFHQIKTISSIVNKVIVRGKKLVELTDLVRGAVLFDEKEDMDEFIKNFSRKNKSIITDIDKKTGKGDSLGYFGSTHFELSIDGFDVELQIMPMRLWNYKEEAHGIYDKWRDNLSNLPKADASLSRKLFSTGNQKRSYKKESYIRENYEEIKHFF